MKLIKWNEIRWDIVRKTAKTNPWWILGWPVTVFKTTDKSLFKFGKDSNNNELRYLLIRVPFTHKIAWTWNWEEDHSGIKDRHPVISHDCLRFNWNGFLWFWRKS